MAVGDGEAFRNTRVRAHNEPAGSETDESAVRQREGREATREDVDADAGAAWTSHATQSRPRTARQPAACWEARSPAVRPATRIPPGFACRTDGRPRP